MKRTFLAFVAVACSAAAYGAFMTGFEAPAYVGGAAGIPLTAGFGGGGQDLWYLPVAGSVDWNVYTYAGNALGFSTLPVVGQLQFVGGESDATGVGFALAQRGEAFAARDKWTSSFYIAWKFAGTLPASQYVGSFSQQPVATNRYWQSLYAWVAPALADHVDSGFLAYDAAGVMFPAPGQYPGPEWMMLPVDHWYREDTSWDYTSNTIKRISITDMDTGITTVALPPYPVPAGGTAPWYLTGGIAGGGAFPIATDYRFFAGGINNAEAVDNLKVVPGIYLFPETFGVGPGIVLSGDVRHLFESEDQKLVVRPGVVISSAQAPVDILVRFTSPTALPGILNLIVESSANQANIGQTMALRNVGTGLDEVLDSHTLTLTDTTTTVVVFVGAPRFVDPATNMITARIRCRQVGPILSYPWLARFDRITVTGGP